MEISEDELLCSVCSELFIKAVTLPCLHKFCQHCIDQWRAHKSDCPICRAEITDYSRTTVLDDYIEKIVEGRDVEYRNRRKAEIAEREKQKPSSPGSREASYTYSHVGNVGDTSTDDDSDEITVGLGGASNIYGEYDFFYSETDSINHSPGDNSGNNDSDSSSSSSARESISNSDAEVRSDSSGDGSGSEDVSDSSHSTQDDPNDERSSNSGRYELESVSGDPGSSRSDDTTDEDTENSSNSERSSVESVNGYVYYDYESEIDSSESEEE